MKTVAAVLLVMAANAGSALAGQDAGSPFVRSVLELLLNDGSRLYGAVESQTDTEIVFLTTSGARITAPRERVVSITPVIGRMVRGEFRREDTNNTRMLFGPTGRALPKGQAYLGVYQFMMPFVQVGVTDRISIGGGTPLVFGFDESDRPYWITPKVQLFSRNGLHAAAGVFHGFSINSNGAGVVYGVVTREGPVGAFTIGAGLGYSSEGGRTGVLMVGGEAPISRNRKLVSENYVWSSGGVVALGIRFFGENLSADLALGVMLASDFVMGVPVVNFVYRF